MPSTIPSAADSREVRRRLRARGRRVRVLRRRVGALTAALFVASWAAIYAAGSFGKSSTQTTPKVASVAARAVDSGSDSSKTASERKLSGAGSSPDTKTVSAQAHSVSSKEDSTSAQSASSTPSAVTTRQS